MCVHNCTRRENVHGKIGGCNNPSVSGNPTYKLLLLIIYTLTELK